MRSDTVKTAINCESPSVLSLKQNYSLTLCSASSDDLQAQCATMLNAIFIEHVAAHATTE